MECCSGDEEAGEEISEERIREILRRKLDAKDYEGAAKVVLYWQLVKVSPEEFAERFVERVKDWILWGEEGATQ